MLADEIVGLQLSYATVLCYGYQKVTLIVGKEGHHHFILTRLVVENTQNGIPHLLIVSNMTLCLIKAVQDRLEIPRITVEQGIYLSEHAADFITKPWDNDELIHKLKDVLEMQNEIVTLDEMEKEHVRRTIDHCHGNLSQAAELLGITRQTLYNKMRRL